MFQIRSKLWLGVVPFILALLAAVRLTPRAGRLLAERAENIQTTDAVSRAGYPSRMAQQGESWKDSLGDGFPDGARLDLAEDRENFSRWVAFLVEARYYRQPGREGEEIQDCAGLVRYAFRNALVAHTPAWRRAVGLPYEPGFGDVVKFHYPAWPLGRGLFRTRSGPFERSDMTRGIFAEFADSATLLHYNTFQISRDIQAARPGDLLFFHQPTERQPFHAMVFIGRSYFQSGGSNWIVYHTGELNGQRGEVREVQASLLTEHPDPRWRPLVANPRFLGVYRFELLR